MIQICIKTVFSIFLNFFRFWVEGFWISCLLGSRGSLIDRGNKKRKEALTMTGRTERRIREIRRRTRQYRKRYERRVLSTLSVCSLLLFAGIGILLRKVQSGGVPTVTDSYGSVLLRGGTSAYVVVGIAAFAVGVTVTMICIRLKNKSKDRTVSTEERED